MSDVHAAAPVGGGAEPISVPVEAPSSADTTPISATEAARQLANWRYKRDNPEPDKPAEPQETAEPPQALAETPNSDPPQEAPADTTNEPEPALPTIEPPRSWTKEEKEEFATYPREAQEKIARREQDRETALRRSQNEAAEQRKAIEVERQAVQESRQRYETALPALLQTLQEQQAGEFGDIRSIQDVERLAREDWPRYALWDAHQKKIAAVSQEVANAQARQEQERQQSWAAYAAKQDQLLIDRIPDLADKTKSQQIADMTVMRLRDAGFEDKELSELWTGKASVSLRDARLAEILIDAARYKEAKTSIAKTAPKPVPPVQRPGVSKAPSSAADAEIETLAKRFERTGNMKDGAALLNARRRAGA